MKPAVLLDRDGVLNEDLPGSLCSLKDLRMIQGSAKAVGVLCAKGYIVLVITNQACVGRGDLSVDHLEEIHSAMEVQITNAGGKIHKWFICPHRADEDCLCRKPRPGLIHEASRMFAFNTSTTFFVGDAGRDVEAARAAGCVPILVRTGKGLNTTSDYPKIDVYDDLLAFANAIPPIMEQH